VGWLYTRRIDLGRDNADKPHFEAICALWAFGDRREIPCLMNDATDAMRNEIVRFLGDPV